MMLAAASDLLLALVCAGAAAGLLRAMPRAGRLAMLAGLVVVGVAALLGALRYALWPELAGAHRLGSDLAAGFGLPAVVLGLLTGWRTTGSHADAMLLAALALIVLGAAIAGQPRVPGSAIALLAATAGVWLAPPPARTAGVVALLALLASAGFASRLPEQAAIAGLHLALAAALAGWCRAWRLQDAGQEQRAIRSAQTA